MIFSRTKQRDMENRANILEATEMAIRHGYTEIAKELGQASATLKEKIAHKDYSKEETFEEIWKRKVNEGAKKNGLQKIY